MSESWQSYVWFLNLSLLLFTSMQMSEIFDVSSTSFFQVESYVWFAFRLIDS